MNPRRRRRLATQAKAMKASDDWSVPIGGDPLRRSLFASRALLHEAWKHTNFTTRWKFADSAGTTWELRRIDPPPPGSKVVAALGAAVTWCRRHA